MRKKIVWADRAKASLRAIDQPTALRILRALGRLLDAGEGDIKQLQGIDPPEFRLRVGDYRVFFDYHGDSVHIRKVKHRREAYR